MLTHERMVKLAKRYAGSIANRKAFIHCLEMEMILNQPVYRFNEKETDIETLYYRDTAHYGEKRAITYLCPYSDLDSGRIIVTSRFFLALREYKEYPTSAIFLDPVLAYKALEEHLKIRHEARMNMLQDDLAALTPTKVTNDEQ